MCVFALAFSFPSGKKLWRSVSSLSHWSVTTMQLTFATFRFIPQVSELNATAHSVELTLLLSWYKPWRFSSLSSSRRVALWNALVPALSPRLKLVTASWPKSKQRGTPRLNLMTRFAFKWKKCFLLTLFVRCRNRKLFVVSEHPEENKGEDERGAGSLQGFGFGVEGKQPSLLSLSSDYKSILIWLPSAPHASGNFTPTVVWWISYWLSSAVTVSHTCEWGQKQSETDSAQTGKHLTVFPNETQLYAMIFEGNWSYKNEMNVYVMFSFFSRLLRSVTHRWEKWGKWKSWFMSQKHWSLTGSR